MNVLWTADRPLTITEVHEKLAYPVAVMRATAGNTLRRLVGAGYAQHTTTQGTPAYAYSPAMPYAEYLGQVVAAALGRSPDKLLTLSLGMCGAGLGHLADLLTGLPK
jgi:predicted transcriptional regulator